MIDQKLLVRILARNEAGAAIGQFNRQMEGLGNTVRNVAAGVLSALAFRDVIQSTREFTRSVGDVADSFGVGARAASQYAFQAKFVGATTGDLTTIAEGLTRRIFNQTEAIMKGESEFDKWGISVLDATGAIRPMPNILDQVRNRVQELGPGLASRGLEMEIFGRAGGKLHDFLMLDADAIARLNREAAALGLTLDEKLLAEMEANEQQLNLLGMAFDSIKITLGQALIPLLVKMVPILRAVAGAFKVLMEAMRGPLGLIKEILDRFGLFVESIRKIGLAEAFKDLIGDVVQAIPQLLSRIGEAIDDVFGKSTIASTAVKALALALASVVAVNIVSGVFDLASGLALAAARAAPLLQLSLAIVLIGDALQAMGTVGERAQFVLTLVGIAAAGLLIAVGSVPAAIAGIGIALGVLAVNLMSNWSTIATTVGNVFSAIGTAVQNALSNIRTWFDNLVVDIIGKLNSLILKISEVTGQTIPHIQAPTRTGGGPTGTFQGGRTVTPPPPGPTTTVIGSDASGRPGQWTVGGGGNATFSAFQHGGIVTRPTMGLVGEAGPEAIIPLGRGGGMGTTIIVNVSGNVTRSEQELADRVADRLLTVAGGIGQLRHR